MSDSNRVRLLMGLEESYNGDVDATEAWVGRITSETLAQATTTVQSQELRADRQVAFVARVGLAVAGDLAFELTYGTWDRHLQATLQSAGWSAGAAAAQFPAALASDGGGTYIPVTSLVKVALNLAAGDWVRAIDSATGLPLAGAFKVESVVAGAGTSWKVYVKGSATGEVEPPTAGASAILQKGAAVVNGVQLDTFKIEREYEDLGLLALFGGIGFGGVTLSTQAEQIVTGSFAVTGKTEGSPDDSFEGDVGQVNTTTWEPMTGVDNVPTVLEGPGDSTESALVTREIVSSTLQVQNNLRGRPVVGTLGPKSLGSGTFVVTGTIQTYHEDATWADAYLGFGDRALAWHYQDSSGNAYVIDLPRCKLTQAKRPAGALNTDAFNDVAFSAFRHPTEDVTMRVARFPADTGPRLLSAAYDTGTATLVLTFDRPMAALTTTAAQLVVHADSDFRSAASAAALSAGNTVLTLTGLTTNVLTTLDTYLEIKAPTAGHEIKSAAGAEMPYGDYPVTVT